MRSHQILFVVLVALCALAAQEGVNGQALKKLFGMVGKTEADAPADAEVIDDYDQKSAADAVDVETVDEPTDADSEERDNPTTPRPGFFHQFSFPTLPPFTFPPFPAIPALPALPAIPPLPPLPQLPTLPNLATIFPTVSPRQTIVATQTLLVEVTRRVTRVPICMSVIANRPPCVVNDDTVQGGSSYRADPDSLWNDHVGEEGRIYIQPTAAYLYPEVKPTTTPLEGESREGKYLELKAARGEEKDVTAELESSVVQPHAAKPAAAGTGVIAAVIALGLPVTHIVSRTLYVTRVDTVTDYRVTATLAAYNCVPTGVNIPYCRAPPPAPFDPYSPKATTYPTRRPPTYPTTRRTTYPTTYPTTRRTTYPTTYPTTRRTTYPTTYPTTQYTTRRTTTRYTTPRPATSYPNHPYGAPAEAYPPYGPQTPDLYEPVNTPSPYKGGEIDEQVDAAEGVDEVLDNLTKA